MGSRLQLVLRSLCLNTGWQYAVFWKLNHRARMTFTWEDAYCDCSQYPDKNWSNSTAGSFSEGPHPHDPLGLDVAKMSYQVYSLGEGAVGHVAASGKHLWIFSDQHVADSSTSSKYYGGWQMQFSAGIKTIAVLAVMPHGVVQLGSLHKIAEDLKLVDHIRNIFSKLQDSLANCVPTSLKSNMENTCLSGIFPRVSDSAFNHYLDKLKGSVQEDDANLSFQFSSTGEFVNQSYIFLPREGFPNKTLKTKIHEKAECSMAENDISLPSSCGNILPRQLHREEVESFDRKYAGETYDIRCLRKRPDVMSMLPPENVRIEKSSLYSSTLTTNGSQMAPSEAPPEILDSSLLDHSDMNVPGLPTVQLHPDFENLELPIDSSHVEMQVSPFSFAGYELYEALGPSFNKQNDSVWEAEKTGSDIAVVISEGMGSCNLLIENSDMHLLDAVVAKASHRGDDTESEISCHVTGESILTAERTPCTSVGTMSSAGFSFDQTPCTSVGTMSSAGFSFDRDTSSSFNSVTCGVESLKGIFSTSSSRGSEHMERPRGLVKINKKRARPGESCRPRPRDRQLIQDRIKELRELIPNGSKCSIDSLLERAIKHMIFLQSVTKHAEKLQKCSASKLHDKDSGMRKFSRCEQGSSWAVEVGNNQKVCPIIVENINMNGQMLVEMLCKECGQFLEIGETIRSLGLTILKGVAEGYGNKTWMCFVVEGQNNRSMHRMDVLWSLMQLLQPKISD